VPNYCSSVLQTMFFIFYELQASWSIMSFKEIYSSKILALELVTSPLLVMAPPEVLLVMDHEMVIYQGPCMLTIV